MKFEMSRTLTWMETFTPEGASEPTDRRFLAETVTAEATTTQEYTIDPFARAGHQPGHYRVVAFESDAFDATLTADTNGDGALLPASGPMTDHVIAHADTVSATQPYRLPVNDDDTDGDGRADATDDHVNGTGDLAHFHPVFLNIKSLLAALPPGVVVRLSQADGALNFVYTDLKQSNAFDFRNDTRAEGYGPNFDQSVSTATVLPIPRDGVILSEAFLERIRYQNQGVILIEARFGSTAPLVLTVETGTGTALVSLPLQAFGASLAVDANRDGQIKFASEDASDTTSQDQPFRFWINDDDDTTNGSPQWSDLDPEFYPPRRPDSADRVINSPRDCEDLARLWVNLNGLSQILQAIGGNLAVGLKWKNFTIPTGSSSTGPCIRLFRSADNAGGLGHIKDATIAAIQADRSSVTSPGFCLLDADVPDVPVIAPDAVDKVQPTARVADFIFKTRDLSLNQGSPTTHLLFEGVSEGKGELEIVILRNKNTDSSQPGNWELVGEGPSVWLQLDNIRRMYLRVHSTPFDSGFPYPWAQESPPAEPYFEDTSTTGKPITILPSKLGFALGDTGQDDGNYGFVPSPDEQAKCVVFVHGIDMTVDAQRGYSQSFFKRLWWEGYRGRFIAFRWNTPLSGLENWLWGDPNFSIFNSGEYRSWKAGTSLNKFANALRDSTSSFYFKPNAVIGLVAHSLGNACATEALKQGAPFDSYIAMEAAIPLSCFYTSSLFGDPQPPTVARLLDAETQKPTPQFLVDGGYQGYLYDSPGETEGVMLYLLPLDLGRRGD
jgi:hypothetical protein